LEHVFISVLNTDVAKSAVIQTKISVCASFTQENNLQVGETM